MPLTRHILMTKSESLYTVYIRSDDPLVLLADIVIARSVVGIAGCIVG